MTAPLAAMALCSVLSATTAARVAAQARHLHVDPALALAVAITEDPRRPGNPLGVQGCTRECVRAGVVSLRNRLRAHATVERALSGYHRGRVTPEGLEYARRVMELRDKIVRRMARGESK